MTSRHARVTQGLATIALVAVVVGFVATLASANRKTGELKIGAFLPLSGELAGFGSFQKWGYEHAVADVNARGGIRVDGERKKVKLIILDDKTDPNTAANDVDRLIYREQVDGLLGSCTPSLVNAGALVADRNGVPMVTGCDPLGAFTSVKKWTWAWDLFFAEPDLAAAVFATLEAWGVKPGRVAILHDNGPDGQVVGGIIWPQAAKSFGWKVVLKASFPVNATQFGSLVQRAKSARPDLLLVDAVTPQGVAIRKQMAAANFTPKYMNNEKGAEPVQYAQALGKLSDGVLVGAYWDPSLPYPGAKTLRERFERDTGRTFSQHLADSMTAAQVLMDAMARAGTTEPQALNRAIAATDKTYVAGPIKFGPDHTAPLKIVEVQWQGGETKVVGPDRAAATGRLIELSGG